MLFEAEVDEISVAGGGRYDRLCTLLGAENPIPAVGFSISLDRVEEAKQ
jgi:ATP phosphoribosyltransferase regulatory subunit